MNRRTCRVSEANCLAPAAYGTGDGGLIEGESTTRSTCYECGEPVCANCSKLSQQGGRGPVKRLCVGCLQYHDRKGAS